MHCCLCYRFVLLVALVGSPAVLGYGVPREPLGQQQQQKATILFPSKTDLPKIVVSLTFIFSYTGFQ